jgi:hypothetical protein
VKFGKDYLKFNEIQQSKSSLKYVQLDSSPAKQGNSGQIDMMLRAIRSIGQINPRLRACL